MTDNFPTYPIYRGSVAYDRELMSYDLQSPRHATRTEGLPRYRIRDHRTFIEWMYPSDPGEEAVLKRTKDAWLNMVENPQDARSPDFVPRNPQNVSFKVERLPDDEWHLTWFCHETIDVGQTDQEALDSFQRFLDRKGVQYYGERHEDGAYCAMGAEDRRRWRGETPDDPPPCRCDGCKESGMIRIAH